VQVQFGLQFAYDIKATFVLDVASFTKVGIHGGYSWFERYTGLSYNEMTLEFIVEQYKPTVVSVCPAYNALQHIAKHGDAACNTLYILQSTGCCSYMHGTQDGTPHSAHHDCWYFDCTRGVYEHFQPIMIQKYETAQVAAVLLSTVYNPAVYNVAIHIRTGDLQLHVGDIQFFINMIRSTVSTYLSHMPVHIYYIGQFGSISDNTHTMTESPTADWSFLNKLMLIHHSTIQMNRQHYITLYMQI
jgi:hypothetical protein